MIRMMSGFVALAVSGMQMSATAQTNPSVDSKGVATELSSELTECWAYFTISAECVKRMPNPEARTVANNLTQSAAEVLARAGVAGTAGGIMEEALLARMEAQMKDTSARIDSNCGNISI